MPQICDFADKNTTQLVSFTLFFRVFPKNDVMREQYSKNTHAKCHAINVSVLSYRARRG